VQYKTEDITPTYWFHYTPDALVVPEASAIKTFQDFLRPRRRSPESSRSADRGSTPRTTRRTSASTRSSGSRPSTFLSGYGRYDYRGGRRPRQRRDVLHRLRDQQQGQMRALAVAMDSATRCCRTRHVQGAGRELVDGAFRGIGMPKSTPPAVRKRMSTCGRR